MQNLELLLSLSLLLSLAWVVRGLLIGSMVFCIFMVWNMLLAAVPAVIMMVVASSVDLPVAIYALLIILSLLFLPNAYYILTDFMHLNQKVLVNKRDNKFTESLVHKRGDPLFILDSFLLYLTVTFGALAGGYSLHKFNGFMETNIPTFRVVIIVLALVLCATGVFIGRYGRWNSWDALYKPHRVIVDLYQLVRHTYGIKNFLVVTCSVLAFEILSWIAIANYR